MTKNAVKYMMVVLMILVVALYFISGTYARYTSSVTGTTTVDVAKWSILFKNGTEEFTDSKTLTFTEVPNKNVVDNFIAPASQLYADFTIDPNGSQVAVDYTFAFGEIQMPAEYSGEKPDIKVAKVVKLGSNGQPTTEEISVSDGSFNGTINLKEQTAALTSNEALGFRVYIEWTNTEDKNATDTGIGKLAPQDITLKVTLTAQQHID